MLHGTTVGTDSGMAAELEDFIRQQKSKLAYDRAASRPKMSPRGRVESPVAESASRPDNVPVKQAPQEVGFLAKMGNYEEQKRRLQDERRREYNEMLQKKNLSTRKPVGGAGDSSSPRDSRPAQGAASRTHGGDAPTHGTLKKGGPLRGLHDIEYKHMLSGKSKRHERSYTPDDDGDYPQRRQTSPPDRGRHYNGSSGLPNPPHHKSRNGEPEFFATLPLRNHPSAQHRKEQERNREYNEFLSRGRHVSDVAVYAGRLHQRRESMSDSDDEYKQFLQQRAPRRGWATPTYEETLEEKRKQERRYRDSSFQSFLKDLYSVWLDSHSRYDDPELYQPFELRNSVSDGHLDRSYDDDDRRLRLDDDRRSRGPYRDQDVNLHRHKQSWPCYRSESYDHNWRLSPGKRTVYREPSLLMLSPLKHRHRTSQEDNELLPNRRHDLNLVLSHKVALPPKAHNPQDDETYGTSLPIGHELSLSEQLRRKEEYREQLTRQIEQEKAKKNKVEHWVDAYKEHEIPYRSRAPQEWEKPAAGISSVKRQPQQPQQHPQQQPQQQPQQRTMKVSQYPETPSRLMDDLVRQPPDRLPPPRGTNGILERGFEGLYEPLGQPNLTPAPPPSSLLNMPGIPSYANQLDQAYHYYGSKNLLDPTMPATAPPMSGPAGHTPRPTYPSDQHLAMPMQLPPRASPGDMLEKQAMITGQVGLGSDDLRRNQKEKQMSYQAELLKQIEEQKNKKLKQKQDEEKYNMKMEEQLKIYDPFGKGGGGAPVRDADGNLVTNRKQAAAAKATEQNSTAAITGEMANLRMMHLDNEEKWRDPSKAVSPRTQMAPPAIPVMSQQQVALASPVAEGGLPQEQQHGRGASLMRILGDGMTEVQKTAQQKYQDDLRRQIEDKKRKQEEEKRQQQMEDERLMQKIEEENRKMQEQLEQEKRKEREKQEEAQRQQEQLKKVQEERRKEVERTRKEAEEKRQEDLRRKQEEEQQRRKEEEETNRPVSPPIRSKTQPFSPGAQTPGRYYQTPPPSPPIPALAPQQPPSPPIPTLRAKDEREDFAPPRSACVPALQGRDEMAGIMDERPTSPPLPANRSKTNPEKMASDEQLGRKSPPVPAKRSSSRESRPPSAEVLNQLAHMRKQLLNERKRIEGDLKKTQDEPEVYDPRVFQRPTSKKSIDVFEVARTGEPVSHRHQGDVSSTNLREFQQLRNKEDTESRQNLRSMFPDEPMTSDALETQQRVLLTEQEETLKKMAKRKSLMKRLDPNDLGLLRDGSIISANMLESDSAFIAVSNGRQSGLNSGRSEHPRHLPNPASGRRRRRQVETPDSIYTNPMGSVRSLDPDSINSKNEERLRKLKALTEQYLSEKLHSVIAHFSDIGDDISVADPEDVLDRFMAKQQHKRPPSSQTLDDDTWLRPGTGANG